MKSEKIAYNPDLDNDPLVREEQKRFEQNWEAFRQSHPLVAAYIDLMVISETRRNIVGGPPPRMDPTDVMYLLKAEVEMGLIQAVETS